MKKYTMKSWFKTLMVFGIICFNLQASVTSKAYAEPYGVSYTLEGFIEKTEGVYVLTTEDGRVFSLIIDAKNADSLLEHRVKIDGKAHRGDEIDTIKVEKIVDCPAPENPILPEEHAYYQRPVTILETTPDSFKVKDVRWSICQDPATSTLLAKHEWETAVIKPELVENVYFTLKPFFPKFVAGHSMLVCTFKSGGFVTTTGKEAQALAVSIEAYKKVGQSYGLIKCMKKNFDIVWNLVTWANYATLNVKFNLNKDTSLYLYPVKLSQEQKVQLVREMVIQAGVNRQGEYYHTTRNNCTNNLVMLLNKVLPAERQIKLWTIPGMVYNFRATMPVLVVKKLTSLGLLGEALPVVDPTHFTTDISTK
ncbi:MAG: DUF4105 domain-containing protein [Candidatus Riflebacteria bacterium]|nr:DUF4105 domain-containing protein [Candidatus Riflebacteria bacterium]